MASVIVVGKNKNREVSLADAVTVIGRDGGASIELGDLQVSRRHALLVRAAEGYFVKDLGSRNGVLVNHRRVPSRQQARLRNGDVLSVGRTTLVFKDLVAGAAGADGAGDEPKVPTLVRVPSSALEAVAPEDAPGADESAGSAGSARSGADEPPGATTEDALVDSNDPDAPEPGLQPGLQPGLESGLQPSAEAPPVGAPADGSPRPDEPTRDGATPAPVPAAPRGAGPVAAAPRVAASRARPPAPAAPTPRSPAPATPTPGSPALAAAVRPVAPAPRGRPAPAAAPAPAPGALAGTSPVQARPSDRASRGRSGRAARPADAIPRALPAGAGLGGLGGADVLLRALERAERERVFYRNLVLVLAGLVMATFVALLAWAVAAGRRDEPAAIPVAAGAPAERTHPGAAAPPAALDDLDAAAFARDVQPVLSARCASCHSAVGRGGGLVIAQSEDARTVEANLWAVRRFVRPGRPQESPLLLKPLPAHEGGQGHGGGEVLSMDSPEWRTLAGWVGGAPAGAPASAPRTGEAAGVGGASTPAANRAPAPRIELAGAVARLGEALPLRGAADDADGDALSFRWALKARPAGSSAAIEQPGQPAASLVPDTPGTYVVLLVVHDGRASGTAEATLVVDPPAPVEEEDRDAGARAFQALTGAAAPPEVAAALGGLAGDPLVAALLQRPEVYQAWWDAELEHFALTGEHRPKGATWDSVPDRLRTGRLTAVDALQAVLFSQGWTARHAGRDAYVAAVLERVLDLRADEAAAARPAAERLYDGHPANLLGKPGESQADLVRIAAQDPRARRALLARAHRRVTGRDATPDVLDAALARVVEAPAQVLPIVVGWACR